MLKTKKQDLSAKNDFIRTFINDIYPKLGEKFTDQQLIKFMDDLATQPIKLYHSPTIVHAYTGFVKDRVFMAKANYCGFKTGFLTGHRF